MRKKSSGFTIVEVSLFLAITGLLFLSVTIGVQNSIYQQRYNDSVQSFADFLRTIYDEVLNIQSISSGRHERAIYGKLLSFDKSVTDDKQVIRAYDVIGMAGNKTEELNASDTLSLLKELNADVIFREAADQPYKLTGIIDTYEPNWGARIQTTGQNPLQMYEGVILIVRDPKSGTVRTLVAVDDVAKEINAKLANVSETMVDGGEERQLLTDHLAVGMFERKRVDFCINPDGMNENHRRTDVRIIKGATNSSGVEIVGLDDDGPEGNACN